MAVSTQFLDQTYDRLLNHLRDQHGTMADVLSESITSSELCQQDTQCWRPLLKNTSLMLADPFPFASQVDNDHENQASLKLVKEACKYQQLRINKAISVRDEEREGRPSLKLKIIRKRSRKLSRTSKSDSTDSQKNSADVDIATTGLHISNFADGLMELNTPHHSSRRQNLWLDDNLDADFLGIEKLIF